MVKLKIGARLKELREAKGVSQTEAGKAIGVSKKTMSCYENNASEPSLVILEKIANYYNVCVDRIITGRHIEYKEINVRDEELLSKFKKFDLFDTETKISLKKILNLIELGYEEKS
jgi:transcriptional regulator with XRE-family HTH domain